MSVADNLRSEMPEAKPALPGAPFDARTASPAEIQAHLREISRENAQRADAARNERALAEIQRRLAGG